MLLNSTMTKQNKNTNFLPVFIDDSLLRTRKILLYIVLKSHAKDLQIYKRVNFNQNKSRKKSKRLENLQRKTSTNRRNR